MDKDQFKKYVQERRKLDAKYGNGNGNGNVNKLDIQYNEYLETKKEKNKKTNEWYNNKIATDPEFKEYKQLKNKETYNKLKNGNYMSKNEIIINNNQPVNDKSVEKPIEKEKPKPSNILNSKNKLFKRLNLY